MKKLLICLTLMLVCVPLNSVLGQVYDPTFIVSVTQPIGQNPVGSELFAGQTSGLWVPGEFLSSCVTIENQYLERSGDTLILFLYLDGPYPECPIPPSSEYVEIAKINGLPEGKYKLNIYDLPSISALPPNPEDYKNTYNFTEFEVLGAVSVDATSNVSLFLLMLLILSANGYLIRTIKQ